MVVQWGYMLVDSLGDMVQRRRDKGLDYQEDRARWWGIG